MTNERLGGGDNPARRNRGAGFAPPPQAVARGKPLRFVGNPAARLMHYLLLILSGIIMGLDRGGARLGRSI